MTHHISIVSGPPLDVFRSMDGLIRGRKTTISGLITGKTNSSITIKAEGKMVYRFISAMGGTETTHRVSSTYVLALPPKHQFLKLELGKFYQLNANGTACSLSIADRE